MKKLYNIKFREVLVAVEEIEAGNLAEALEKAEEMYDNMDVVLTPEHLTVSERISDDLPYLEDLSKETLEYLENSIGKYLYPDGESVAFSSPNEQCFSEDQLNTVIHLLTEDDLFGLEKLYQKHNDENLEAPTELLYSHTRLNLVKFFMYGM